MPTSSIIILSAIVLAFALFGTGLAWGDFYSSRARKPDHDSGASSTEQTPLKKAA